MTEKRSCPKCGGQYDERSALGSCPRCFGEIAFGAVLGEPEQGATPELAECAGLFPDLEVLEPLGNGGMGSVFKARQRRLGRSVALKVLRRDHDRGAEATARFQTEARALAQLRHPSIVGIYDFGQAGSFFYILMEYVAGKNLRQALRSERFSPAKCVDVALQVCSALECAHKAGVTHRDIKPENILIDGQDRVAVADFGLSTAFEHAEGGLRITQTGTRLGTAYYMAPEQAEAGDADHRADIYALGVVLYEMLTGELPLGHFPAPSQKSAAREDLDHVVLKALSKEPGDRYQSAGEMKADLEALKPRYEEAEERRLEPPETIVARLRRLSLAFFATWFAWAALHAIEPLVEALQPPTDWNRTTAEVLLADALFVILVIPAWRWFRLLVTRYGLERGQTLVEVLARIGAICAGGVILWLVLLKLADLFGPPSLYPAIYLAGTLLAPPAVLGVGWVTCRARAGHETFRGARTAALAGGLSVMLAGFVVVNRSIGWGLGFQAAGALICGLAATRLWPIGRLPRSGPARAWVALYLTLCAAAGASFALFLSPEVHPHVRSFLVVPLAALVFGQVAVTRALGWIPFFGSRAGEPAGRAWFRPAMFQVYVAAMAGIGFVASLLPPAESPGLVLRIPLVIEQAVLVVPDEAGRLLAEVGPDGTVVLVTVKGVEVGRLPGAGQLRLVQWDGGRQAFAVAGERLRYARVKATGSEPGREAIEPAFDLGNPQRVFRAGQKIAQAGLGLSPDDLTINRLDAVVKEIGRRRPEGSGAIAVDPERGLVAYAAAGGRIVLESTEAPGRERRVLGAGPTAVRALAFGEDGSRLVSADEDGTVSVWDLATGKVASTQKGVFRPGEPAVLVNGRVLLAVAGDEIRIRVVVGGTEERVLDDGFLCRVSRSWRRLTFGSCNAADLLTFDSDGKRLAAVVEDRVEIWDVEAGRLRRTLKGHRGRVSGARFSGDGHRLVTFSRKDRTIRVWDVSRM